MIAFTNVTKQYGGQILFVDASFQINPGERVGLVGPNGAGKTTIFRLIMGQETADDGSVERPRKLTLGYFNQDISGMRGRTVLQETVAGAGEVSTLGEEMKVLEEQMAQGCDDLDAVVARYGEVQARFMELGGYDIDARAHTILAGLGLTPQQIEADVGNLSGGWKMRVALAKILILQPDVLLLDEPTNYLDIEIGRAHV